MGGGHLSRPDFGMPQPDPDHPLTEFYLLLQRGLDKLEPPSTSPNTPPGSTWAMGMRTPPGAGR